MSSTATITVEDSLEGRFSAVEVREFDSILDQPSTNWVALSPNASGQYVVNGRGHFEVRFTNRVLLYTRTIWKQQVYVPYPQPQNIDELAEAYLPVAVFNSDESYFPRSLDEILTYGEADSETVRIARLWNQFDETVTAGQELKDYLSFNGHSKYVIDFSFRQATCPIGIASSLCAFYRNYEGDADATTVYYDASIEGSDLYLTYYYFYAFDPKLKLAPRVAAHVFDRESVTIRFESTSGGYRPVLVTFAGHIASQEIEFNGCDSLVSCEDPARSFGNNIEYLMWDGGQTSIPWSEVQRLGSHPVIYKARGSHAIFPAVGWYTVRALGGILQSLVEPAGGIGDGAVVVPPSSTELLPLDDYEDGVLAFSGSWIVVKPTLTKSRFPRFIRTPYADWVQPQNSVFSDCLAAPSSSAECQEVVRYFQSVRGLENYASITFSVFDSPGSPPVKGAQVRIFEDGALLGGRVFETTVLGEYTAIFEPNQQADYTYSVQTPGNDPIEGDLGELIAGSVDTETVYLDGTPGGIPATAPEVLISGSIDQLGGLDEYEFEFTADQAALIRITDVTGGSGSNFSPDVWLYAPDGTLVRQIWNNTTVAFDCGPGSSSCELTQTGTYRLVVGDRSNNNTGDYEIRLVDVPTTNENGALVGDDAVTGDISLGDLDSWVFTANAGQSVQIRIIDVASPMGSNLSPDVWLYAPDGTLVRRIWNNTTVAFDCGPASSSCELTQTGVYRLVVGDRSNSNTGDYEIRFVDVPVTNEEGPLIGDGVVAGNLTLGDLDSWVFTANAGQAVQIRVIDVASPMGSNLSPDVWLYAPDGTLVRQIWNNTTVAFDCGPDSSLCELSQTGTYRLVVGDRSNSNTGDYEIRLVDVPVTNENGSLIGDGVVTGDLTLGDLDSWVFTANAGQSVQIRVVDVQSAMGSNLSPDVWLYAPSGTLVRQIWNNTTVAFDCGPGSSLCELTQTGAYRLVVGDRSNSNTGDYEIRIIDVPSTNENGSLVNGGMVTGSLTLGDLDSWVFTADAGESAQIRITDITDGTGSNFSPDVWLYAPNGSLVRQIWNNTTVEFDCGPGLSLCELTQTGVYRLVVGDRSDSNTGEYEIEFAGPAQSPIPGAQFSWPLEAAGGLPTVTQDYTCGSCVVNGQHHVGLDLIPAGANLGVYASAAGTVIDVVSSCANGDTNCNSGFGNTVIIEHPGLGAFSLYAHLEPGSIVISNGASVSKGEPIAAMGGTGNVTGPHLHFEVSDTPGLGQFGYSTSHPSTFGYEDPWGRIEDIAMAPVVVEITNAAGVSVRAGPDTSYPILTEFAQQQHAVAYARVIHTNGDTWYRVALPCDDGSSSCAGWVAGSFAGDVLSRPTDDVLRVEVRGSGADGLNVRTTTTVSPGTDFDKVWDEQKFAVSDVSPVISGSGCSSEWYLIDLPAASAFNQGWICGDFAQPPN